MAERKSGPVKPPVIDLKARESTPAAARPTPRPKPSAAADSEDVALAEVAEVAETGTTDAPPEPIPDTGVPPADTAPEPKPAAPPPPPPPRPLAVLAMPWNAIAVAAVGGAILGTLLTYLAGTLIALPDRRPVIADPAARLDGQQADIADLGSRLAALEDQSKRTQISLDATIVQLDSGLADLRQAIAALPTPTAPADLTPLTDRIDALETRLSAINAGVSPADAATFGATLSNLDTGLGAMRDAIAALETRQSAQDGALSALRSDVGAAKTAIAAQNQTLGGADIAPAVRLPLVVTGIESAFSTGRPYAVELSNLTALLPDLAVPDAVRAGAESGLPRPDAVATRFAALVPTVLAGRTGTSSGDLGQDALDWIKALLAFRPAGEMEGDAPEAVVSRLEGAVGRHDFISAAELLASLPEPMRNAAGASGADILSLAEAERFIAGVRAAALKPIAAEAGQ